MKFKFWLFFIAMCLIGSVSVKAASFNLGASTRNVIVGSNVTIYVNGSDVTGRVNISSSNASVLSSNNNSLWIEPSGSITFKAKKVGSSTITVTGTSLSDGNGNDVSLPSKTITINVIEKPKAASSNNSLKSLTIEGYELDPTFDPSTTEYNVLVKQGTESIDVSAITDDKNANVTGIGNISVSEGLNVISIVVTAENGYQKEYKLNVTVEEEPILVRINDIDMSIVKQESAMPQVNSLYSLDKQEYKYTIDGEEKTIEIPTYVSEVTGYTLVGIKDKKGKINLYIYKDEKFTLYNELNFSSNIVLYQMEPKKISKEFIKTKVKINEEEITAYQKDKNSNYYYIYGKNVYNNDIDWYKYDTNDNSIQKYDKKELDSLKIEKQKYLKTTYVMSGISGLLLLTIIILLVKVRKMRG